MSEQCKDHYYGDDCPMTFNCTKPIDVIKMGVFRMKEKSGLMQGVREYGVKGVTIPALARRTLHGLRDAIKLGSTNGEASEILNEPNTFNPDQYPEGTLVRLVEYNKFLIHPYIPWDIDSIIHDRKSWTFGLQIIDPQTMEGIYAYLGMIASMPDRSGHNTLLSFHSNEEAIFERRRRYTVINALQLGSCEHYIINPSFALPGVSQIDQFVSPQRMEFYRGPGRTRKYLVRSPAMGMT